MRSICKIIYKLCICLVLLGAAPPLLAFDLQITQREFAQLSSKCQLYYFSVMGPRLPYESPFSHEQVKQGRIEAESVGGAWHYCGGLVWLNRALIAADEESRKRAYKMALLEIYFTAKKIEETNHMFNEVQVNYARALFYNEQHAKSRSLLNSLLQKNPGMTSARIEFARQLRAEKQTGQAIKLLEKATEKEFEVSADLNYFLGVYQYHEGNYAAARKYADRAYKLGYPLPWLKQKLAKKRL